MRTKFKLILFLFPVLSICFLSCEKEEYSLGDLKAPSELTITTTIAGQNAQNPNGDGSGDVTVTASAKDALAFKIDFGNTPNPNFVPLEKGTVTKKYTSLGTNTYNITVIAYGAGGTSTIASKTITVKSDFQPAAALVTNLTNNASKTWVVDKSVFGHFGVGPWDNREPIWWQAGVNEKVGCCNCFYTTTFTFIKSGSNFSLQVENPDGAFTKTGSLTNLPGIPASGDEGCYAYSGGTNSFAFIPASATNSASTNTIIKLGGKDIYIGYGSLLDEYEILSIDANVMKLRVQGTETGNAWYLTMIPQQ
jgi:hypothetical protein